jgi:hypothetical protein
MMDGIRKPIDLALFTREFGDEVQAAFPPRWLQRLALAPPLPGARDGPRRAIV